MRVAANHEREWRNWQTRTVQVRVPERAWGFKSPLAHDCDVSVHRKHPEPSGSGCFSLWLVLPRGVQGELAEDLSGGLGHDGDLAVLNDQNDVGSGVGSVIRTGNVPMTC